MQLDTSDLIVVVLLATTTVAAFAAVSSIALHQRGASSDDAELMLKVSALVAVLALALAVLLLAWIGTQAG